MFRLVETPSSPHPPSRAFPHFCTLYVQRKCNSSHGSHNSFSFSPFFFPLVLCSRCTLFFYFPSFPRYHRAITREFQLKNLREKREFSLIVTRHQRFSLDSVLGSRNSSIARSFFKTSYTAAVGGSRIYDAWNIDRF